ncbi:FkbM family methyltransferase [Fluviicola sp.]|uniref:FkbM family methyltransferase n=1 Tax=Fluviicola sp. TaxID=1917219 RepID=UPI0031DD64AE
MKKTLFTNRFAEILLLALIRLAGSRPWVFKFVPPNKDYKPGSHRKAKRKGISYQLDISDYQEWLVYFHCKTDSSDYLLDYLEKSTVIFDIGANIGQTAFNMSLVQQSKGLHPVIYAFEPYPKTFGKLERNIGNNPALIVKAYNLGLGSEKGSLHMMQHNAWNSGGFRMTSDTSNSIVVPVISLDEFVSENQIPAIDFIKIDVEGFELEVLKGARQTIRRFRPVIVFEYSVENILAQQGNIPEALDELVKNNYKISTKEGISDLKAILELEDQTDLICIPN